VPLRNISRAPGLVSTFTDTVAGWTQVFAQEVGGWSLRTPRREPSTVVVPVLASMQVCAFGGGCAPQGVKEAAAPTQGPATLAPAVAASKTAASSVTRARTPVPTVTPATTPAPTETLAPSDMPTIITTGAPPATPEPADMVEPRAAARAHARAVSAMALSADGTFLASADGDGRIKLWSLPEGTLLAELERQGGEGWSLAPTRRGGFWPQGRPVGGVRREALVAAREPCSSCGTGCARAESRGRSHAFGRRGRSDHDAVGHGRRGDLPPDRSRGPRGRPGRMAGDWPVQCCTMRPNPNGCP
jgi:hypothetical protein